MRIDYSQLLRIRRAAIQVLPHLPPAVEAHTPANNLRAALGILQYQEPPNSRAAIDREAKLIADALIGLD